MVRHYNYLLAGITVVALTVPLAGQEGLNEDLSPPISNSVTIGGKKLRVVYRAPSMRRRRIFGGLVLYAGSPFRGQQPVVASIDPQLADYRDPHVEETEPSPRASRAPRQGLMVALVGPAEVPTRTTQ
jgi:hypothetical protein